MQPPDKIITYWQSYRASLPDDQRPPETPPEAWYFCDNEADANELGALVVAGIKTATCSLLWVYENETEHVPQVGDFSIITNFAGDPLGIIQTTEITIRPYDQVDAQFAADEGEGDRSLRYWREAHWRFFSRECAQIGRQISQDMPLVCERFRLVFRG
ncbi:MAG: ASCH domain-containing protein [Chloroflexi bacterium]|nr:ASCH domain-containing protein [Chloroflexota bacterium]